MTKLFCIALILLSLYGVLEGYWLDCPNNTVVAVLGQINFTEVDQDVLDQPIQAVTVPDTGQVFVANNGDDGDNMVEFSQAQSLITGNLITYTFGKNTDVLDDENLFGPGFIAIDTDGRVFVSDTLNFRVLWLNKITWQMGNTIADGAIGVTSFTNTGCPDVHSCFEDVEIAAPQGLLVKNNVLFVVNYDPGKIYQVRNASTAVLFTDPYIDARVSLQDGEGGAIAIDAYDNLYVSTQSNRIEKYTDIFGALSYSQYFEIPASKGNTEIWGIVIDLISDELLVSANDLGKIFVLSDVSSALDGSNIDFEMNLFIPGGSVLNYPQGLSIDPFTRDLLLADKLNYRILRIRCNESTYTPSPSSTPTPTIPTISTISTISTTPTPQFTLTSTVILSGTVNTPTSVVSTSSLLTDTTSTPLSSHTAISSTISAVTATTTVTLITTTTATTTPLLSTSQSNPFSTSTSSNSNSGTFQSSSSQTLSTPSTAFSTPPSNTLNTIVTTNTVSGATTGAGTPLNSGANTDSGSSQSTSITVTSAVTTPFTTGVGTNSGSTGTSAATATNTIPGTAPLSDSTTSFGSGFSVSSSPTSPSLSNTATNNTRPPISTKSLAKTNNNSIIMTNPLDSSSLSGTQATLIIPTQTLLSFTTALSLSFSASFTKDDEITSSRDIPSRETEIRDTTNEASTLRTTNQQELSTTRKKTTLEVSNDGEISLSSTNIKRTGNLGDNTEIQNSGKDDDRTNQETTVGSQNHDKNNNNNNNNNDNENQDPDTEISVQENDSNDDESDQDEKNSFRTISSSDGYHEITEDGDLIGYVRFSSDETEEFEYRTRTADEDFILAGIIDLVSISGDDPSNPITFCFRPPDDFDNEEVVSNKLDCKIIRKNGCLGYQEDPEDDWKCEDRDLEERTIDGNSVLCGKTPHLTSFALLLSPSEEEEGLCQKPSEIYLWISLGLIALMILLITFIIILHFRSERFRQLIYGNDSYQNVLLQKKISQITQITREKSVPNLASTSRLPD